MYIDPALLGPVSALMGALPTARLRRIRTFTLGCKVHWTGQTGVMCEKPGTTIEVSRNLLE